VVLALMPIKPVRWIRTQVFHGQRSCAKDRSRKGLPLAGRNHRQYSLDRSLTKARAATVWPGAQPGRLLYDRFWRKAVIRGLEPKFYFRLNLLNLLRCSRQRSATRGSASLFLEYGDCQLIERRQAVRLGPEADSARSPDRSIIDVDEWPAIERDLDRVSLNSHPELLRLAG
jgi:hypothetical protein